MTPGRLLYLARRDWKRGFAAAWNDYAVSRRILAWRNPHAAEPGQEIPVHLLTGKDDWLLACWMLASWFHFTELNWHVVIHEDGTLPDEGRAALRALLPEARFIGAAEADSEVLEALAPHPACREYRRTHPLARKIFDVPLLADAERFVILDSDLLFFRKPDAVLRWCREGAGECWFNEDVREALPISPAEIRGVLGVEVWPRVNSGLCLLERSAMDLALCERALRETSLLRGHIWLVEQTLFAICASRAGRGGLLPPEYEISLGRHAQPGAVARHYVGAVRQLFYRDGMPRLKGVLL